MLDTVEVRTATISCLGIIAQQIESIRDDIINLLESF